MNGDIAITGARMAKKIMVSETVEVFAQPELTIDEVKENHWQSEAYKFEIKDQLTKSSRNYCIKLIDFGCAEIYEPNDLNRVVKARIDQFSDQLFKKKPVPQEQVGTINFLSPEYIETTKPHINNDVWAVGVLTYYLLTGEYPFEDFTDHLTIQKILNLQYELPDVKLNFSLLG